jgi:Cys-tRNA(Pro) deacylase
MDLRILKMAKNKFPVTPAVREFRSHKMDFEPYLYQYVKHGGTEVAAAALGVDEIKVIKTLVILMHGNAMVSTKNLARALKVKSVEPCQPKIASLHTGYQIGGTSPFGTRKKMPIYAEKTIADFSHVYINAGKRGFLARISTKDLLRVLNPTLVEVAI